MIISLAQGATQPAVTGIAADIAAAVVLLEHSAIILILSLFLWLLSTSSLRLADKLEGRCCC